MSFKLDMWNKSKVIFGDILGGLNSAVITLPQALAFGVATGFGAGAGLWGAVILCFVAGMFGPKVPLISGATGPAAIVLASVMIGLNNDVRAAATVMLLAALFQLVASFTNIPSIIKYVPYPVISGFMNGVGIIIIILGLGLINEVFNKEITIPSILIIIVSIFTIISKYIVSCYIYQKGINYNNNILIASGKESRTDVYSSIFVLISIVLMQFSNTIPIFKYADLVGTIVIAILIIHTGYRVLIDNISILLEEQVIDKDYIKEIKKIILSFDGIIDIGELHILRYGPYYKLLANIIMEDKILLSEAHEIIDKLEATLKQKDEKIKYVYIHMEPQN